MPRCCQIRVQHRDDAFLPLHPLDQLRRRLAQGCDQRPQLY